MKRKLPQEKMLTNIRPMLATLIEESFDNKDWLFEIKLDGFRAIAEVDHGDVSLYSRNLLSFRDRFPNIYESLEKLPFQAILDGEIVILDEKGRSHFQLLQNYQKTNKGTPIYFVFDLLFLDQHNICDLTLLERKEILKNLLNSAKFPFIYYHDHVLERGKDFFQKASEVHLEGIIGKKITSTYRPGIRTKEWVKIKTKMRQETIICGFTEPKGSRKRFGSLILGVYENDVLTHVGEVGTGFDDDDLEQIYTKLAPLEQEKCPFPQKPKISRRATWVKPKIVCEISFSEWTNDGSMRHPVFLGIRIDKKAKEVVKEVPEDIYG